MAAQGYAYFFYVYLILHFSVIYLLFLITFVANQFFSLNFFSIKFCSIVVSDSPKEQTRLGDYQFAVKWPLVVSQVLFEEKFTLIMVTT